MALNEAFSQPAVQLPRAPRAGAQARPAEGQPADASAGIMPILAQLAAVRGLGRYRLHVGDLVVDMRSAPPYSGIEHRVAGHRALLLLPLCGDLELSSGSRHYRCSAGTPFLFAREEAAVASWSDGSWCLAVHFRRDRLNAFASAILDDAYKLAPGTSALEHSALSRPLEQTLSLLLAFLSDTEEHQRSTLIAAEANFYRRLAARLVEDVDGRHFTPVRAVSDAMRLVRQDHARNHDTESLAALAGVTAQTLRKGFRHSLGLTVREYVQGVRLDHARERLVSTRDARPISEIARASGFSETPAFSRAYQKRFGEPPSQTRGHAVRSAD